MKSYIKLIAEKRYEEALHLILEKNPFPGICGRICTHPCEEACSPGMDPGPIPIKELKRYAADYELSRREISIKRNPIRYPERIAVVGAGPAGLTTAVDLLKYGYEITVFEKGVDPGGMLVQCIPRYRLPGEIVNFEIEHIRRTGVNIVTSFEIENLDSLFESGYSAVILAVGAQKDRRLNVPGSDLPGVLECLPFLREINSDDQVKLNGNVVVIGGGSSAFDAARTAIRIGADKVTLAYRRTENEMPANIEEIEQAKEEGVEIITLTLPKEIIGKNHVKEIKFQKTKLGENDSSGRRNFLPMKDSEFTIPADWVIPAVGYAPDVKNITEGLTLTKWGSVKVDKFGRTTKDNVFATGDVVTGPSTVIDVVGLGHRIADIIHGSFRGSTIVEDKLPEMATVLSEEGVKGKCISVNCVPLNQGNENFTEVVRGFGELDSIQQAQRCRSCGSCYECSICLSSCDHGQLFARVGEHAFLLKAPSVLRDKVIVGEEDWKIETSEGRFPLTLESLVPSVDEEKCIACGRCEEVCPYSAVQVRLVKKEYPVAVVDPNVCRTCGICVTSCISDALDQKPLSTKSFFYKINSVSKGKTEPMIFTSPWSVKGEILDRKMLQMMNINAITPALMIDGLAAGASGILIIAPPEYERGHYLESERNIDENVQLAKKLLSSIGMDHRRIKLERGPWRKQIEFLDDFNAELDNYCLGPIKKCPFPVPDRDSPIMHTLAQMEWLSAQPDGVGRNLFITNNTTISYLQCLDNLFMAKGYFVLRDMVSSIERNLMKFEKEPERSTFIDLVNHLSLSFTNVPQSFGGSKRFAFLRCKSDEKYGADILKNILFRLPGLSVTEIPAECYGPDWLNFQDDYPGHGDEIFKECEKQGIGTLITVTPLSTAALRLLIRGGCWRRYPVEVKDVFSFLLEIKDKRAGGGK